MTLPARLVVAGMLFAAMSVLALQSCDGPAPAPESSLPVDLNITALLDLSDRLSPERHPNQAARDKAILRTMVDLFQDGVRRRLYVASRDRLRVAIAQQTGTGYDPAAFADDMRIEMPELFEGGRPQFDRAKDRMLSAVNRLYDAATRATSYTGANIPLFFRDHLEGYAEAPVPGRGVRNVLVIITDGYILLDRSVRATLQNRGTRSTDMRLALFRGRPDWERVFDEGDHGLIVGHANQCHGMDVLVLEIALDAEHQDDKAILFKYWNTWLRDMGCAKTELDLTEDAISQTKAKMAKFLDGV